MVSTSPDTFYVKGISGEAIFTGELSRITTVAQLQRELDQRAKVSIQDQRLVVGTQTLRGEQNLSDILARNATRDITLVKSKEVSNVVVRVGDVIGGGAVVMSWGFKEEFEVVMEDIPLSTTLKELAILFYHKLAGTSREEYKSKDVFNFRDTFTQLQACIQASDVDMFVSQVRFLDGPNHAEGAFASSVIPWNAFGRIPPKDMDTRIVRQLADDEASPISAKVINLIFYDSQGDAETSDPTDNACSIQ